MGDAVNHPDYYNEGNVECIDAIRSALGHNGFSDFCRGQVIKYLWRWKFKGGYEDILKADFYLKALKEEEDCIIEKHD